MTEEQRKLAAMQWLATKTCEVCGRPAVAGTFDRREVDPEPPLGRWRSTGAAYQCAEHRRGPIAWVKDPSTYVPVLAGEEVRPLSELKSDDLA